MAPARPSRRNQGNQAQPTRSTTSDGENDVVNAELFLEPMMGTPLPIYIEKDVHDRDKLVDIITKNGGSVSVGYSSVPYILVDPHKESGQNLHRMYIGKKGKIVLSFRWIHECVKAGALQTYHTNWAGCKVQGTEQIIAVPEPSPAPAPAARGRQNQPRRHTRQSQTQPENIPRQIPPAEQPVHGHGHNLGGQMPSNAVEQLVPTQASFPYQVYTTPLHPHPNPRGIHPGSAGPPQSWQGPNSIAPQQTNLGPPLQMIHHRPQAFREESWNSSYDHGGNQGSHPGVTGPSQSTYDYRYRDEQPEWVSHNEYYDPSQQYNPSYDQSTHYIPEAGPSNAGPSEMPADDAQDKPRGRKRNRTQPTPAAPASTLVANRRQGPARSPTPPSRIIKSTYGGNLFTAEDVLYLKQYIDYCQEQGLVLSLREICERIAVKAPHHTFYSWRRYCNKHQIRLGGYTMGDDDDGEEGDPDEEGQQHQRTGPGPGTVAAARTRFLAESQQIRTRSPSPPRSLFRSTTGKGVAFTEEDVMFLLRFMQYRRSQGRVDMVAFWKDVATKAPHHSRASWMKFWRRHKHELEHSDADEPLPAAPEKKMRYSRQDDVLIAKHFLDKPEGTSDKVFQAFARINPHHPWKGWQEHHRIHKAKIDHLIGLLRKGETIDVEEPAVEED
ncbi:hypothetical protein HWV62_7630 [Athelia sp. TMB]|nr:hypothetical protein HWV62_7630 [Athelia sp. TMB]